MFDRICTDNGIRHILTAPRSPTTTGKVERFHRTLRREFFSKNDHRFETIEEAQAALEGWLVTYNTIRPHQSIGDRTPAERFALRPEPALELIETEDTTPTLEDETIPRVTRRVDKTGRIHLEGFGYLAGRHLTGEVVEIAFSPVLSRSPTGEASSPPTPGVTSPARSRGSLMSQGTAWPSGDFRTDGHQGRRHLGIGQLRRLELPGRQSVPGRLGHRRHRQPLGPESPTKAPS